MKNPANLQVMRQARTLAREVYPVARALPSYEQFGLASQLRRAAISVGSSIAEGCGRHGDRELAHYLQMAMGTVNELEFQLEMCVELDLVPRRLVAPALSAVRAERMMLAPFIGSLRRHLGSRDLPVPRRADTPTD